MSRPRLLIIGASGQMGRCLMEALEGKAAGTYHGRPRGGLSPADLGDRESVQAVVDQARPEVVILCGALTAVDYCEEHPDEAWKVNVEGTRHVLEACRRYNSRIVYLSTEYVFDGRQGPYAETDEPGPISVYGRTKREAEKLVQEAAKELGGFLIIRSTVIYSYDPGSKNFIMQLMDYLSHGRPMRIPGDQVSNPTYAPDLARILIELMNRKEGGLFHVVGLDRVGRYDFAVRAARILGFGDRLGLLEYKRTSELNQKARRPLNAGLKTDKLKSLPGLAPPLGIEDGVRRVLDLWKADLRRDS